MDLLDQLAKYKTLLEVRGAKEPSETDDDRQLILRFFAMTYSPKKFAGRMKQFLHDELRMNQKLDDSQRTKCSELFKWTIDQVRTGSRAVPVFF